MKTVTAVVICYNREDFVGTCVRSVLESQDDTFRVNLHVMDNGSTDGSAEAARTAGGEAFSLHRTVENRPVIEVYNEGIQLALDDPQTDFLLLMNEDTEWTPGSLRKLVDAGSKHHSALLTPLQINYREPGRIDNLAFEHVQQCRELIEDALLGRAIKDTYPVRTIIGAGMFGHRSVFETLGLWDSMFLFYGPDDDYCNRARYRGYEILIVPQARLLHAHGKLLTRAAPAADPAAFTRRWKSEIMANNLFILKDPQSPLWWNYFRAAGFNARKLFDCIVQRQARGFYETVHAYAKCVLKARTIALARKEQFATPPEAPASPEQSGSA